MPGSVDDFMRRFGGDNAMDENEAAQYHERFVSTHNDDRDFDNATYHKGATEYLGKLDDDQFQTAARNAFEQAPPQERQGLIGGLMNALGMGGGGAASSGLAGLLGLRSNDPREMGSDDYARLMNYARRERPEVVQQTVQEKPWFLKAMGHPVVMGALAMAAAKLVQHQRSGR
ncbi:hypothetical protein ACXR0O_14640 [Verrucomicrobiota bacterium sgz303538]